MVPPEPPAPSIVAGSLRAVEIYGDCFMVVRMTDDSLRIVSFDGVFPIGGNVGTSAEFSISCEPGTTPTPPVKVPLSWVDYYEENPTEYLSIEGNLVFGSYVWDESTAKAEWGCVILSGDVKLSTNLTDIIWDDRAYYVRFISD